MLPSVKKFFIQCIIYLSTVENLNDFQEEVVRFLVIVMFPFRSQYIDNQQLNLLSKVKSSDVQQKYEIYKVRIMEIDSKFIDLDKNENNDINRFTSCASSELLQYVEKLKLKAMSMNESVNCTLKKEPNAY